MVYCADDAPAAALYIDFFIEVHEALVVHSVPVKRLSVIKGLSALTQEASGLDDEDEVFAGGVSEGFV